jgi:hypothetical protein
LYLVPRARDLARADADEFVWFVCAYTDLLTARLEARERGAGERPAPLPASHLVGQGVPRYVLGWMLYQGHAEAVGPDGSPAFAGLGALEAGSIALTDRGEAFALTLFGLLVSEDPGAAEAAWGMFQVGDLLPHYDPDERVFGWGHHVLKRFVQPAGNQVLALGAAQEQGWPRWLDDPLPARAGRESKAQLHDTIQALNRNQRPHLVRFVGDGTGRRYGWVYQ